LQLRAGITDNAGTITLTGASSQILDPELVELADVERSLCT